MTSRAPCHSLTPSLPFSLSSGYSCCYSARVDGIGAPPRGRGRPSSCPLLAPQVPPAPASDRSCRCGGHRQPPTRADTSTACLPPCVTQHEHQLKYEHHYLRNVDNRSDTVKHLKLFIKEDAQKLRHILNVQVMTWKSSIYDQIYTNKVK